MSDEARMWTELGRLGEDPLPGERSDADLVAAALAEVARAPAAPVEEPSARPRAGARVGIGVALVLALAAAVLLGWWLLPATGLVADRADGSGSLAPAVADDRPAGGQVVARAPGGRGDPGAAPEQSPRPEPDTAATSDPGPGGATAEASGAPISADAPAGTTPDHEPAIGPEPATSRRSTAPGMLEHAQRLVSKGERVAAIAAYERLLERFPASREAAAGLVSLGRLELDRGRASQALARFDAYLAGSAGALVEEARYGRIRSLRQLGRAEQELRSIEAFLADHPESLYAARLRKRAEELRAP